MFRQSASFALDSGAIASAAAPCPPAPPPATPPLPLAPPNDRRGSAQAAVYAPRTLDPRVVPVVIALHLLVGMAIVMAPAHVRKPLPPSTLKTFEIAPPQPPAPPPPAQPAAPTPNPTPTLTTPVAQVQLPLPTPTLQAPPPPVAAIPAQAAPVAAPPATAPPAPITPPDFSAAQLNNRGPAYPFLSRRAHEQGVVLLRVLVTAQGRADTVTIQQSSGYARLDDAARKAVLHWQFVPARRAGAPIGAWVIVPVTFALHQS